MELIIGVIKAVMVVIGTVFALGLAGIIGLAMLLMFGWIFLLLSGDD